MEHLLEMHSGKIKVKQATKKGYAIAEIGDGINIGQPNSKTRRGRVQKQSIGTLLTQTEWAVVEGQIMPKKIGNVFPSDHHGGNVYDTSDIAPVFKENHGNALFIGEGVNMKIIKTKAKQGDGIYLDQLSRGKANYCKEVSTTLKVQVGHAGVVEGGHKKGYITLYDFLDQQNGYEVDEKYYLTSDRLKLDKPLTEHIETSNVSACGTNCINSKVDGKQPSLQDRIYDEKHIMTANCTSFHPSVLDAMRVRKLTPREGFRLMGLKDNQISKIIKSGLISNSKMYMLAGNSIVVPVIEHIIKEYMPDLPKSIKIFEAFSGYGSQHQAFKNLGFDVTSHISEWFTDAIIAYALLHHNVDFWMAYNQDYTGYEKQFSNSLKGFTFSTDSKNPKDISKRYKHTIALAIAQQFSNNKGSIYDIKGADLDHYDVFTYSFPCQDISNAGKGEGMARNSGTRSGQLWEVERILQELKGIGKLPKYLLMENVPMIHSKKHINDFEEWQDALVELGYENDWFDLNAKDFGVPQNRKRTFMVSKLSPNAKAKIVKQENLFEEEKIVAKIKLTEEQIAAREIKMCPYSFNSTIRDKDGHVKGSDKLICLLRKENRVLGTPFCKIGCECSLCKITLCKGILCTLKLGLVKYYEEVE